MDFLNGILQQIEVANGNWLMLLGLGVFLSVFVLKQNKILAGKALTAASVVIGVVLGLFVTWMTGNDVLVGAYDGLLAGLIASGGYDLVKAVVAIVKGDVHDLNGVDDILDDGKINDSNK